MNLAMCEVPVHPVEFLSDADLSALPVLPMTQAEDGTWYCDGESTQDGTPSPDNPVPIINTYPAGIYKAICGDKTYKVVLDDDLRSITDVADRVRIDAGRGLCWIDRKINAVELNGSNTERWKEGYGNPLSGINKFEIQIINSSPNNYGNAICTHFKNERTSAYPSENGFFRCVKIYFLFRPSLDIVDEHSISSWRTWLSANPIKVQYIVDAPTTHQSIPTQLVSISSGRSVTIEGTVNDAVDMLAVKGDSWQLVQEEITDEDGNVTQPAMPSPEYPSEIVSVGGEIQSCGWNLFDMDKLSDPNVFDKTWKSYGYYGYCLHLKPNTIYVISRKNVDGYKSGSFIKVNIKNDYHTNTWLMASHSEAGNVKQLYITTSETGEIWLLFPNYFDKVKKTLDICGILQITETASKKLDRHRGNSITLPTLRSLPDGTRDVLYVDRRNKRAWVERCVGVAVFDGSEDENWKVDSNNGFRIAVSEMKNGKMLDGYCNRFRSNIGFSRQCIMFGYNSSILYFPKTLDIADTVEAWKSWLSSNPVTVLYPLAEPVIEELTYSDYLLRTAQYETNLMINCAEHLEPEISATVKVMGR